MNDITQILDKIEDGDPAASEQLLPLVYEELRKLAAARLAHERPGQTLQATALVHDAYMRLVGKEQKDESDSKKWNSRGHFFGAAATAMRRILIERARRSKDHHRVSLTSLDPAVVGRTTDLLALDEALDRLEQQEPEVCELVKLRFFAGCTIEESARALNLSVRTANRHWAFARAWLFQQLTDDDARPSDVLDTESGDTKN